MKFENQAAMDSSIKTIKSTITRYNNWVAKDAVLMAQREQRDSMTQEEEKAFWMAYSNHKARKPASPTYGGPRYKDALHYVPQMLKEQHGIVLENSMSTGGCKATAEEILALLG